MAVQTRTIGFQEWLRKTEAASVLRALRAPGAQPALSEVLREQVQRKPLGPNTAVPWTRLPEVTQIDTFPGVQSGYRWGFLLDTVSGELTDWTGLDSRPGFELSFGQRFSIPGLTLGAGQRALVVLGGNTPLDALRILLAGLFWVNAGEQFVFAPYEHNLSVNLPGPAGVSNPSDLYAVRTSRGDFVGNLGDVLLRFWGVGHLKDLYCASYPIVYTTLDTGRPTTYNGLAGSFSLDVLRDEVFAESILITGGIPISAATALREIRGGAAPGQTLLRDAAYAEAAAEADRSATRGQLVRLHEEGTEYFQAKWPDWLDNYVTGLPTVTVAGFGNLGKTYLTVSVPGGTHLVHVQNFAYEHVLTGLGDLIARVGAAITPVLEQAIFAALFFTEKQPDVTWTEGGIPRWVVYADLGALRDRAMKTATRVPGPYAVCDSWAQDDLPVSEFVAGRMPLHRTLADAFAANHGAPENRRANNPAIVALAQGEPEREATRMAEPKTTEPKTTYTVEELKHAPSGTVVMDARGSLFLKVSPTVIQKFMGGKWVGTEMGVNYPGLASREWVLILPGTHGRKDLSSRIREVSAIWDKVPLAEMSAPQLTALMAPRVLRGATDLLLRRWQLTLLEADNESDLEQFRSSMTNGASDAWEEQRDEVMGRLPNSGALEDLEDQDVWRERLLNDAVRVITPQFNELSDRFGVEPLQDLSIDYRGLEEQGQGAMFGGYSEMVKREPVRPVAAREPEREPPTEAAQEAADEIRETEDEAPSQGDTTLPDELLTEREFRDVYAVRNLLYQRGWSVTGMFDPKGNRTDNQFSAAKFALKNRLTDQEGIIEQISKRRYVGGEYQGEDRYILKVPADWEIEYQQAFQALHAMDSSEAPDVREVPGSELVKGDVVMGIYASEIRVWMAGEDHKLRTLAHSSTQRRMGRFIQARGKSASAPDFTPAKIQKQPGQVLAETLAKVEIVLLQGTRIFWQNRSTAGPDVYVMAGRIGRQKAAPADAADPWAVELTPEEQVKAQAAWEEAGSLQKWEYVGNLAGLVSDAYPSAGSISAAVGVVLRAAGVDARLRMSTGTGYGHIDIRFPSGQSEKLAAVLRPDRLHTDTAAFSATGTENKSDASTDYYHPGGAALNPAYAQAFLRAYVQSAHAIAARTRFRGVRLQSPLARWIWQRELAARAASDDHSSGERSRGEKRGSWQSPKFGEVTIVEGAEGRRDTWHNISAVVSGKRMRYGFNGSRWARSERPPEALLAEVAQEGWGHLFGVAVESA